MVKLTVPFRNCLRKRLKTRFLPHKEHNLFTYEDQHVNDILGKSCGLLRVVQNTKIQCGHTRIYFYKNSVRTAQ